MNASAFAPEHAASDSLVALLADAGWAVDRQIRAGQHRPDFVISKGGYRYAVEAKSASEGRPDRVLGLLSQAILQARRYADELNMQPLAVVVVRQASSSLARRVEEFQHAYAPDVAVGLVSERGGSLFIGPGLEGLSRNEPVPLGGRRPLKPRKATNLFSDLNQWMLKVLLAPELPEKLLSAPRGEYRTGADLADAAGVSAMSASRFVRRMQEEGFLDDSDGALRLVRREELFRRWQSAAMRSSPELRMSYLIPAGGPRQLHRLASKIGGCVGLFAAADLLGLGHVSGAVPMVYVRKLEPPNGVDWPGLVPSAPGEPPQLILKQAIAPESVFRGAVRVEDVLVSDVMQVWLDASAHPSRGAEQAGFLRDGVLASVLGG